MIHFYRLCLLRPMLPLLVGAAILAACAETPAPTPTRAVGAAVYVILDYGVMSYEQIIDDSDAVFLARVLAVSGTTWNQDNGGYWNGGLPVYTMELEILRPLVDSLALPDHVTLTQVAYSPLEYGSRGTPAAGQRAVFFVVQTDIAWRDGLRTVLRTTNTDSDSIIVVGDDRIAGQPGDEAARLEKIVRDIAERREILPQP